MITKNLRRLRLIVFAQGPSALGQRKKSPHQILKNLEKWSGRATIVIIFRIAVEIFALFWSPRRWADRTNGTIANIAIGAGLIIEYVVILKAIVTTREANDESDQKVANANKEAEQDRQKAEEAIGDRVKLEFKLQPRLLNQM